MMTENGSHNASNEESKYHVYVEGDAIIRSSIQHHPWYTTCVRVCTCVCVCVCVTTCVS